MSQPTLTAQQKQEFIEGKRRLKTGAEKEQIVREFALCLRMGNSKIQCESRGLVDGFLHLSVPFDQPCSPHRKGSESIRDILTPGCFDNCPGEVPIFVDHDKNQFVGFGHVSSNQREVVAEVLLDEGVMERLNALGEVFSACSPTYFIEKEQWITEDTRRIIKARLCEMSLTNSPAFRQAAVEGMPHIKALPPEPVPQPRADQHPRWAGGIGFTFKAATPQQKQFYQWTLQQASQRRS